MITPLPPFHDELSLVETATALGKRAIQLGLLPSFVVRYFADSSQFYIPDESQAPLTPEQAYMQFRSLIGEGQS